MYASKFQSTVVYVYIAIKNLRTEYFSYSRKKIDLYFHIHFKVFRILFSLHVISVKYTLISNNYKNRRR